MNKRIELPLVEPAYSTYHFQGPGAAIAVNNDTARNWYLNEAVNLSCNRKFLNGFTTPEIMVPKSFWAENPNIEQYWIPTRFLGGYINPIIRKMIDSGYYVAFDGIDDYYVKGKSWYKERHINHDGLLCGYDQSDKTYCIYSYDSNWIYRKFWTPQKSFNAGRNAMNKQGVYGNIVGIKMKDSQIECSPKTIFENLKAYTESNLKKNPFDGEGDIHGIAVLAYIAEYVMRLYRGDIPYERMDRRVLRLIWEHKKVMLERIAAVETVLGFNNEISEQYKPIVSEAETLRMLYASHHLKRRDSLLPIISKRLLMIMEQEEEILTALINRMRKELENESVEISQK